MGKFKRNQGFYKGHKFKITGISPIQLNGPVELKLSRSEAYEMFTEVKNDDAERQGKETRIRLKKSQDLITSWGR